MKSITVKTILGATLVLAAITNAQASSNVKNKKRNIETSKVSDKTNSEDSISSGSKTEITGK